jgi:biotin synthase-related radical SAM superfamily protein
LIYTTPPKNPEMVDQLFEAGADRISMSLEIWDEELARKIMPGKMKFTGRQRHLNALEYVANKYGKGKSCSNFIIGLEPAESVLEGADYLASKGIVPIASVWIPFGRPVLGSMKAPELEYYQKVKNGLADIYCKYDLVPPGAKGLNVCMCRDIYMQKIKTDKLKIDKNYFAQHRV